MSQPIEPDPERQQDGTRWLYRSKPWVTARNVAHRAMRSARSRPGPVLLAVLIEKGWACLQPLPDHLAQWSAEDIIAMLKTGYTRNSASSARLWSTWLAMRLPFLTAIEPRFDLYKIASATATPRRRNSLAVRCAYR